MRSLPTEVLCSIFAFVQVLEDLRHATEDSYRSGPLAWITITHVCRRWRDIVLSSPHFWVDLPIDTPKWVQEMVKRSKDCGLTINACISGSDAVRPGLVLALANASRIKEAEYQVEQI